MNSFFDFLFKIILDKELFIVKRRSKRNELNIKSHFILSRMFYSIGDHKHDMDDDDESDIEPGNTYIYSIDYI